ncbi:MAG: 50S ribosomal protein L7/L12 [Deltaproteobacteria bacterium]|jgi:large subunit ribosomal protein L7/L12|nr:50S ribosomal protein L7/L12 [Deltaproteobacteria bacterium]
MTVSKEEVIEFLKNLSVIELSSLVKELEEVFGVSAAAPVAVAAAPAAAGADSAPKDAASEQTEFTLVLSEVGPQKINIIKEVRTIVPGLGLKEAKELVEGAPQNVKEGLSKEDAEKFKKQLETFGAKVEIK